MEKKAFNTNQTAEYIGVCPSTIRNLIHSGELPHIRISPRRIIIVKEHLDKWLAEKAAKEHGSF